MKSKSLFTRPFLLMCISQALFAASFNMIIPELPSYLTSLGGGEHKGWIIALFTITAGISRPFSGKLADTIGRLPVMYIGVAATMLCSFAYPFLPFVSGFFLLRFLHGFSTGFKPTGTSAYVADIVPDNRRGEAMGILGISFSIGMSTAPIVGAWLGKGFSLDILFYTAGFLAVLSMVILYNLPETLVHRKPFSFKLLRIKKDDIFDPLSLPAGIVMVLSYGCYGVILTLGPDLSDALGLSNRGIIFAIFTVASITVRIFAGRVSDRIGRVPVLKVSSLILGFGMVLFGLARTPEMLYLAAAVFGIGNGTFSPAINAWTVDLGHPERRGRALATMYIALEIAIGCGAVFSGWYFANDFGRMPVIFFAAAVSCFSAWLYLTFRKNEKEHRLD